MSKDRPKFVSSFFQSDKHTSSTVTGNDGKQTTDVIELDTDDDEIVNTTNITTTVIPSVNTSGKKETHTTSSRVSSTSVLSSRENANPATSESSVIILSARDWFKRSLTQYRHERRRSRLLHTLQQSLQLLDREAQMNQTISGLHGQEVLRNQRSNEDQIKAATIISQERATTNCTEHSSRTPPIYNAAQHTPALSCTNLLEYTSAGRQRESSLRKTNAIDHPNYSSTRPHTDVNSADTTTHTAIDTAARAEQISVNPLSSIAPPLVNSAALDSFHHFVQTDAPNGSAYLCHLRYLIQIVLLQQHVRIHAENAIHTSLHSTITSMNSSNVSPNAVLLSSTEWKLCRDFLSLSPAAAGLLARLSRRIGPWFRTASFQRYPELQLPGALPVHPDTTAANTVRDKSGNTKRRTIVHDADDDDVVIVESTEEITVGTSTVNGNGIPNDPLKHAATADTTFKEPESGFIRPPPSNVSFDVLQRVVSELLNNSFLLSINISTPQPTATNTSVDKLAGTQHAAFTSANLSLITTPRITASFTSVIEEMLRLAPLPPAMLHVWEAIDNAFSVAELRTLLAKLGGGPRNTRPSFSSPASTTANSNLANSSTTSTALMKRVTPGGTSTSSTPHTPIGKQPLAPPAVVTRASMLAQLFTRLTTQRTVLGAYLPLQRAAAEVLSVTAAETSAMTASSNSSNNATQSGDEQGSSQVKQRSSQNGRAATHASHRSDKRFPSALSQMQSPSTPTGLHMSRKGDSSTTHHVIVRVAPAWRDLLARLHGIFYVVTATAHLSSGAGTGCWQTEPHQAATVALRAIPQQQPVFLSLPINMPADITTEVSAVGPILEQQQQQPLNNTTQSSQSSSIFHSFSLESIWNALQAGAKVFTTVSTPSIINVQQIIHFIASTAVACDTQAISSAPSIGMGSKYADTAASTDSFLPSGAGAGAGTANSNTSGNSWRSNGNKFNPATAPDAAGASGGFYSPALLQIFRLIDFVPYKTNSVCQVGENVERLYSNTHTASDRMNMNVFCARPLPVWPTHAHLALFDAAHVFRSEVDAAGVLGIPVTWGAISMSVEDTTIMTTATTTSPSSDFVILSDDETNQEEINSNSIGNEQNTSVNATKKSASLSVDAPSTTKRKQPIVRKRDVHLLLDGEYQSMRQLTLPKPWRTTGTKEKLDLLASSTSSVNEVMTSSRNSTSPSPTNAEPPTAPRNENNAPLQIRPLAGLQLLPLAPLLLGCDIGRWSILLETMTLAMQSSSTSSSSTPSKSTPPIPHARLLASLQLAISAAYAVIAVAASLPSCPAAAVERMAENNHNTATSAAAAIVAATTAQLTMNQHNFKSNHHPTASELLSIASEAAKLLWASPAHLAASVGATANTGSIGGGGGNFSGSHSTTATHSPAVTPMSAVTTNPTAFGDTMRPPFSSSSSSSTSAEPMIPIRPTVLLVGIVPLAITIAITAAEVLASYCRCSSTQVKQSCTCALPCFLESENGSILATSAAAIAYSTDAAHLVALRGSLCLSLSHSWTCVSAAKHAKVHAIHSIHNEQSDCSRDHSPPCLACHPWLHQLAPGSLFSTTVWEAIDPLERGRAYAITLPLLAQLVSLPYTPHRSGRWWARFSLNLLHCGFTADAAASAQLGLQSASVTGSERLALLLRNTRLQQLQAKAIAAVTAAAIARTSSNTNTKRKGSRKNSKSKQSLKSTELQTEGAVDVEILDNTVDDAAAGIELLEDSTTPANVKLLLPMMYEAEDDVKAMRVTDVSLISILHRVANNITPGIFPDEHCPPCHLCGATNSGRVNGQTLQDQPNQNTVDNDNITHTILSSHHTARNSNAAHVLPWADAVENDMPLYRWICALNPMPHSTNVFSIASMPAAARRRWQQEQLRVDTFIRAPLNRQMGVQSRFLSTIDAENDLTDTDGENNVEGGKNKTTTTGNQFVTALTVLKESHVGTDVTPVDTSSPTTTPLVNITNSICASFGLIFAPGNAGRVRWLAVQPELNKRMEENVSVPPQPVNMSATNSVTGTVPHSTVVTELEGVNLAQFFDDVDVDGTVDEQESGNITTCKPVEIDENDEMAEENVSFTLSLPSPSSSSATAIATASSSTKQVENISKETNEMTNVVTATNTVQLTTTSTTTSTNPRRVSWRRNIVTQTNDMSKASSFTSSSLHMTVEDLALQYYFSGDGDTSGENTMTVEMLKHPANTSSMNLSTGIDNNINSSVEENIKYTKATQAEKEYSQSGWRGLHCEGSVLKQVLMLLLWDVVFWDGRGTHCSACGQPTSTWQPEQAQSVGADSMISKKESMSTDKREGDDMNSPSSSTQSETLPFLTSQKHESNNVAHTPQTNSASQLWLHGTFVTPYQDAPLDLDTRGIFSVNRAALLCAKLAFLATATPQQLCDTLADTHRKHFGQVCRGVRWDAYPLALLQLIAIGTGGRALALLADAVAWSHKMLGGGMPDLLLWRVIAREVTQPREEVRNTASSRNMFYTAPTSSTEMNGNSTEGDRLFAPLQLPTETVAVQVAFVEVKGPRDTLSEKQHVWLRLLLAAGLDARLCKIVEPPKPSKRPKSPNEANGDTKSARSTKKQRH